MSGRVGSVISKSGMVDNVGVAVGISSPYVSVQQLFPLPVSTSGFVADIWVSAVGRCRTLSAVPYLSRAWSKYGGSRWNRVAIAFRSTVIFTSGLYRRNSELLTSSDVEPCRSMSANVGSDTDRSDIVENVRVAVEIASLSQAVPKLLPLPF